MTDPLLLFYSLLLGLVIGSFLNVCVYRIPIKKSIIWPPSACPKCNAKIKWYDNIPVLSYLLLRGKCRKCGLKISKEYPLVELISGLITLALFWVYGLSWWTLCALTIVYCLIILSAIDLHLMIIPDRFSLGLTAFGLATAFLNPAFSGTCLDKFLSSLLGGAVGFFGLWGIALLGQVMFKKESMGGGDIKLMAAVGTVCGLMGVVNCLVVSSFAGIVYFGFLVLLKKPVEDGTIPFGPFISAGLLFNLFFPNGVNLLM